MTSSISTSRGIVTRSTFSTDLADFQQHLRTCSFLAIDEELTGITFEGVPIPPPSFKAVLEHLSATPITSSSSTTLPNAFRTDDWLDRPDQRYERMRMFASMYSIIQLGVCLFHEESTSARAVTDVAIASTSITTPPSSTPPSPRYVARPYTFWLFPSSGIVCLQAATVDFLCQHKMDFNKWMYEGIRFVSRDDAKQLREKLAESAGGRASSERTTSLPSSPIALRNDDDRKFIDHTIASLREWYESLSKHANEEFAEFVFPSCNSFLRATLKQRVATAFPSLFLDVALGDADKLPLAAFHLPSDTARERLRQRREADRQRKYEKTVGALLVFDALVEARKPIVGHHCLFDFLFLLSHFASLPTAYAEFKRAFHATFPLVFDTRFLSTRTEFAWTRRKCGGESAASEWVPRFSGNHLEQLYRTLLAEEREMGLSGPLVRLADGFDGFSADSEMAHDAGFDAFMTGYVFARFHAERPLFATEPMLHSEAPLANTLQLFRNIHAVRFGSDEDATLEGEFVLFEGVPEACRTSHIEAILEEFAPEYTMKVFSGSAQVAVLLSPKVEEQQQTDDVRSESSQRKRSEGCISTPQRERLRHKLRTWCDAYRPPAEFTSITVRMLPPGGLAA